MNKKEKQLIADIITNIEAELKHGGWVQLFSSEATFILKILKEKQNEKPE